MAVTIETKKEGAHLPQIISVSRDGVLASPTVVKDEKNLLKPEEHVKPGFTDVNLGPKASTTAN